MLRDRRSRCPQADARASSPRFLGDLVTQVSRKKTEFDVHLLMVATGPMPMNVVSGRLGWLDKAANISIVPCPRAVVNILDVQRYYWNWDTYLRVSHIGHLGVSSNVKYVTKQCRHIILCHVVPVFHSQSSMHRAFSRLTQTMRSPRIQID